MTARRRRPRRGCSRSCARRTSGRPSSSSAGRSSGCLSSPVESGPGRPRDRQSHLLTSTAVLLSHAPAAPRGDCARAGGHRRGDRPEAGLFRSPVGLRHPLLGPTLEQAPAWRSSCGVCERTIPVRRRPSRYRRRILDRVRPGTIVLLHDRPGPGSEAMIAALPEVIDRLRADGYRFVTVSMTVGALIPARTTRPCGHRRPGRGRVPVTSTCGS